MKLRVAELFYFSFYFNNSLHGNRVLFAFTKPYCNFVGTIMHAKKETITFALNQLINVRYFITGRFNRRSNKICR